MGSSVARFLARAVVVCVVLGASGACFAMPSFLDRFMAFYKPDPKSALAKAQCDICHMGPPRRNPFGRRLEGLVNHANDGTMNGGVTVDDLIFVENEDSDGDGYTNLEEIMMGTLPGDPTSHPNFHPKNLPKHHLSRKFNPLYEEITGGIFALALILTISGKAAKKPALSKFGLACFALFLLSSAYTVFDWFVSNRHP